MIRDAILARRNELANAFANAKPFRYVVIDDFLDPAVAEAMLESFPAVEDPSKLVNEFGERNPKNFVTDVAGIGGVYRDIDNYIQQREFISFVETVTGIPDLRYDPHYYGAGTHENFHSAGLDAHYDFNIHPITHQHRRLNAILYLNKDWDPAWKGSICFHSDPWDLEKDEIVEVQPAFNRLVIFETNEKSWHSVPIIEQPPELRDRSRKSFTIYMYTDTRPAEEAAPAHGTVYVQAPLSSRFAEGYTLNAADVQEIKANIRRRHEYLRNMYKREYKFAAIIDEQKEQIKALTSRTRLPLTGWAMVAHVGEPLYEDGWMSAALTADVKATRDITRVKLTGWRPDHWGEAEVKFRVNGAYKLERCKGRFEMELALQLKAGERAPLSIEASARPAEGGDQRTLSMIVEQIEFS